MFYSLHIICEGVLVNSCKTTLYSIPCIILTCLLEKQAASLISQLPDVAWQPAQGYSAL